MIVKVSKKREGYSAFCAELVDVISAESYLEQQYGTGECTDEDGAEYALEEFNNMFRDIIGWYKYEVKSIPTKLKGVDNFTIQFDKSAYNSYYYNHEDTETYNVDEKPTKSQSTNKTTSATSTKANTVIFQDKNIVVRSSLFGKGKLSFTDTLRTINDLGARSKIKIDATTDFILKLGNVKISSSEIKKIEQLKSEGKDIRVITDIEFLEMIK